MRRIILSILMLVVMFNVTGCGKGNIKESSNNLHKAEFVDLRYNEPNNYSKKEPIDMGDNKVIVYRFNEDDEKTINLYYYKNIKLANDEDKYEEVTLNGIKWKKFHATDFGITYDTYEYVYNNGLYRIELNVTDKYKEEFDKFMKDVSF